MNNRILLMAGMGILLVGLVARILTFSEVLSPDAVGLLQRRAAAEVALPREEGRAGQVREFALTVSRLRWELGSGRVVDAYAYSGRIPGPELRVTEGDTVRVTVENTLAEPTTIHWHGVEVPVGMDGVPGLSQEPIPPGGSFTYQFVAKPAGTRWYHAHFDELKQQGGGLVGALIVDPAEERLSAPDREYVLVTGQWRAAEGAAPQPPSPAPGVPREPGGMMGPGMMGQGGMGGMMRPGGGMGGSGGMMGPNMMGGMMGANRSLVDAFSVNGKSYPDAPPLLVRQGERVRLRLVNAGATETQAFALAGHGLVVTHTDGNPLARPVEAQGVVLGVGERVDVEFVADNPGRWQLRGLVPGQAERGLAVDVVYEGHDADPVQLPRPGNRLRLARHADFGGPPHPAPPDRIYALTLSGGMMMGPNVWTIDGASYPYTRPIEVQPGERVRIRLFNMSMQDHPMHLHGHTFQVVAIGGRAVDGPLKDTLTVRHMEQYEIEFVANNPGVWLFHCHNLQHMEGGLMTEVHYR